jgi:hypothetical protein
MEKKKENYTTELIGLSLGLLMILVIPKTLGYPLVGFIAASICGPILLYLWINKEAMPKLKAWIDKL